MRRPAGFRLLAHGKVNDAAIWVDRIADTFFITELQKEFSRTQGEVVGCTAMHIEYRDEFRCSPAQLWPFIDDIEKQKLWLTTLIDVTSTSPVERAVGSTFDMRVREGRRISHYEGRINAYEPQRHLGVAFWGGRFGAGVVMKVHYRLADLGNRTRLEYYAEIDTSSLPRPVKLTIPLARVFTFFQLRYFMRNLKRLAEAAARSPSKQMAAAGRAN